VVVIDDDLGRSGGGIARKGFERLLVAIGNGSAGAVLILLGSQWSGLAHPARVLRFGGVSPD
jgi:hypothetical protein